MDSIDNDVDTRKDPPMKNWDWLLITLLVLILLITFPVLWRVYRFLLPLAAVGFTVYFIIWFFNASKNDIRLPDGTMQNFTAIWSQFRSALRRSFRAVSITIISVLLISVVAILVYGKLSQEKDTTKKMTRMKESLEKYKSHHNQYPAGLAELIGNDPLKKEWYQDSWGNEIVYKATKDGQGYELRSSGPDGKLQTEDDLVKSK